MIYITYEVVHDVKMKLGVLLSGGKDSLLALYRASKYHSIECLISVYSDNKESFMFHTPNINIVELQSKALGIPLVKTRTRGLKEEELIDLERVLKEAVTRFKIEGVVSGAIQSTYQTTRIQRICNKLGLWCFNPLWQNSQLELLNEVVREKFEVIITGIGAYPLTKDFLGLKINNDFIKLVKELNEKFGINPAGEGGEFETTVLWMPLFKQRIVIDDYEIKYENHSGSLIIKKSHLEEYKK